MHELSVAHDILNIINDNLGKYPGAEVNSVSVDVGIYSGVDLEALKFTFLLVTEGKPVDGTELHIDTFPLAVTCNECGKGPTISDSLQCPLCKSINITVESGRELTITSIDLTLPDEN